jgi:tellurite resistance protein
MAKKKYSLAEAVSVCALYTCGSDGHTDDTELKVISEDPFFSEYDVVGNIDLFLKLIKDKTINETMKNEFPEVFESCDNEFKKNFVNSIVKIILADGEIEENEITILNFSASLMGLSPQEVNDIIENETARKKAEFQSTNTSSSGGGCFVATATLGDYDHPVVLDLRLFRDKVLSKSVIGNLFIKFYYKIGPFPAKIISKSNFLRKLSFTIIIKPLHTFVSKIIK